MKKYFKFMICAVVMMSIFLIGGLKTYDRSIKKR